MTQETYEAMSAEISTLRAMVQSLRAENVKLRGEKLEIAAMMQEGWRYDAPNTIGGGVEPTGEFDGECVCPDCSCHARSSARKRGDGLGIALVVVLAIILLNFVGCLRVVDNADVVGADELYHREQGRY